MFGHFGIVFAKQTPDRKARGHPAKCNQKLQLLIQSTSSAGSAKLDITKTRYPLVCLGSGSASTKIGVRVACWERGLFKNVVLLEILDSRDPQSAENKRESDHFLEKVENLVEMLEILEIPPVKRPVSQ